jgi:hypothetical protein
MDAFHMTPEPRTDIPADAAEPLYCETCDRIERDPLMLDTETCRRCGGNLHLLSDMDDDQPEEWEEWRDYDPDC